LADKHPNRPNEGCFSFRNTVPYGGESDVVIEKGDAIRTDYVSYLQSYPGHQSRTVIVGTPTAEQLRDYAINIEVHRKTIDRCRAGASVHDLWQACMDDYKKHGWPHNYRSCGARASSSWRKGWCWRSSRT
jgi:Xaa-Pro aminopeptidase